MEGLQFISKFKEEGTWFADRPLLERYFQKLDYSNLTPKHNAIPAEVLSNASEKLSPRE